MLYLGLKCLSMDNRLTLMLELILNAVERNYEEPWTWNLLRPELHAV